jgi:hypothetical protein
MLKFLERDAHRRICIYSHAFPSVDNRLSWKISLMLIQLYSSFTQNSCVCFCSMDGWTKKLFWMTVLNEKMPNIPSWKEVFCTNLIYKIPDYWMVKLPCEFSSIPSTLINERSSRHPAIKYINLSVCRAKRLPVFYCILLFFFLRSVSSDYSEQKELLQNTSHHSHPLTSYSKLRKRKGQHRERAT